MIIIEQGFIEPESAYDHPPPTHPTPAALLPQKSYHLDAATISLTDLLKASGLWGPAPPVNAALTLKFVQQESPASTIFTQKMHCQEE